MSRLPEWIMATASVLTGIFIAYQSVTLKQSLEATYRQSIFNDQVGYCRDIRQLVSKMDLTIGKIRDRSVMEAKRDFQNYKDTIDIALQVGREEFIKIYQQREDKGPTSLNENALKFILRADRLSESEWQEIQGILFSKPDVHNNLDTPLLAMEKDVARFALQILLGPQLSNLQITFDSLGDVTTSLDDLTTIDLIGPTISGEIFPSSENARVRFPKDPVRAFANYINYMESRGLKEMVSWPLDKMGRWDLGDDSKTSIPRMIDRAAQLQDGLIENLNDLAMISKGENSKAILTSISASKSLYEMTVSDTKNPVEARFSNVVQLCEKIISGDSSEIF